MDTSNITILYTKKLANTREVSWITDPIRNAKSMSQFWTHFQKKMILLHFNIAYKQKSNGQVITQASEIYFATLLELTQSSLFSQRMNST